VRQLVQAACKRDPSKLDLEWGYFNHRPKKAPNSGTFWDAVHSLTRPMNRTQLLSALLGDNPSHCLWRGDAPYALLSLQGPDAGDFLQRLCSQDVLGVAEGVLQPAAFLNAKGKLLATAQVVRLEGQYWLETSSEQASQLLALLERYHFTEKLQLALRPAQPVAEWVCRAGGASDQRAAMVEGRLVCSVARRGIGFHRIHGAQGEDRLWSADGQEHAGAVAPLSPEHAEALRMAAGFVRVGLESEPATLALEADLDDHCSSTKGCYTGQEIIARIHTYGHTNRRLCLLWLGMGEAIRAAMPLHEAEDNLPVGRVFHAVPLPGLGGRLGLGYLPTDFQAAGTRLLLAGGGEVAVLEW